MLVRPSFPLHAVPGLSLRRTFPQVVGFVAGYILESFRVTVYAVFGGVLIASFICVPDWGIFKGILFLSLLHSLCPTSCCASRIPPRAREQRMNVSSALHSSVRCVNCIRRFARNVIPIPLFTSRRAICNVTDVFRVVSPGPFASRAGANPPQWLPEGCTERPKKGGNTSAAAQQTTTTKKTD
jgi:hypothetical protein